MYLTFPRLILYPLAILLFTSSCPPREEDLALKVYFLDVGHGDCILIQTPDDRLKGNEFAEGLVILIDGGEEKMGREIVLPFLKNLGIDTIHQLIATHFHSDHIGGLLPVLESYPVKRILTYTKEREGKLNQRFFEMALTEGCPWHSIRSGDTLFWGKEMSVSVLNPTRIDKEENKNSVVLKIEYQGKSLLLTGDIEEKRRKSKGEIECSELVNRYRHLLPATVLKVPHHGSETSSSEEFLLAVSPEIAVITAGRKKFGPVVLPETSVVLRLKRFATEIYRTDLNDTNPRSAPGDDHILIKIDSSGKISAQYLPQPLI